MALRGFSASLGDRGVQTDLKIVAASTGGTVYMLGSQSDYVQLASNAAAFVSDWDVVAGGVAVTDTLLGLEVKKTDLDSPARIRPLAVGDTFRTDQLASGSDVGAILGTSAPNVALGVDPATGKVRLKQATDVELFRIASDGGNTFDIDGSISVEVTALK